MTTWIDTNVLAALWNVNGPTQEQAQIALQSAAGAGWFAISGCVYAELMAGPDRSREVVHSFLDETQIAIGWHTGEDVWRPRDSAPVRSADESTPALRNHSLPTS